VTVGIEKISASKGSTVYIGNVPNWVISFITCFDDIDTGETGRVKVSRLRKLLAAGVVEF